MDWSSAYNVAWTIGIAILIVALLLLVSRLKIRPLMVAIVGLLLCGGAVAYFWHLSGEPNEGATQSPTAPRSQQPAGESTAGRTAPGNSKSEGERSREIVQTEKPDQVSDSQRQQVRDYLADSKAKSIDHVDFSLVIGGSVPREVSLDDLPAKIADTLNGYSGDQYLLVRDQLVIVDPSSRRIVALIPGVA
ncbi:MAG TPA: DUF1236 domain-containing protein [Xanthobacteraceae bacterium]|jgi:hypothetical protein|nr:DUF1236 domain-containing protein [Xanthobacteraceae bacterium]